MDSFVLKSISRNHHLRICFMWSLWKFPVKLDRTRLTSVISANCLTAPPDSSASRASLLKQNPLGCEHIEEKRRSWQQRIRSVRSWRALYLFADAFPPGSVHCGAVKSWKENNYNPKEKYTLVYLQLQQLCNLTWIQNRVHFLHRTFWVRRRTSRGKGRGGLLTVNLGLFFDVTHAKSIVSGQHGA